LAGQKSKGGGETKGVGISNQGSQKKVKNVLQINLKPTDRGNHSQFHFGETKTNKGQKKVVFCGPKGKRVQEKKGKTLPGKEGAENTSSRPVPSKKKIRGGREKGKIFLGGEKKKGN